MNRLKILYLMSDFPYPPRGGGALRIMGLVSGAIDAGHEVHLISFGDENQITADTPLHDGCQKIQIVPPPTRTKTDRLKTLLFSSKADMERRFWSDAFLDTLRQILSKEYFDIIQFQSLEMGVYVPHVRHMQPQARLIYDAYNAEAEMQKLVFQTEIRNPKRLPMAIYSGIQSRRLDQFERTLCQSVDAVLAVSDTDQTILDAMSGQTPVHVVNNGIHVQDYETSPPQDQQRPLHQPALVFTGLMDYRPNVDAALWFAETVLPRLSNPAHFYIVGNRPAPSIAALDQNPNITVTGFVPEVAPYLHASAIFVVPLRMGSGTRLKILQAMAARCAIVSTHIGAMGLGAKDGNGIRLADTPTDFAKVIADLLQNPEQRQTLGEQGYEFVRQNFDWTVIVPRLLDIYHNLVQ